MVRGTSTGLGAGGSEISPFNPGPGTEPPYLAGREPQKRAIHSGLDRLRQGERPGGFFVLFGPRGNGKTVMLGWIRREAKARGIETLNLTAGGIRTEQELVGRIALSRWWDRIRRVSLGGVTVATESRAATPVARTLRARLRRRALVLLIDEAHILDVAVGKVLLPEVQQLVNEGKPLLMVLAGTPGLSRRLSEMEASFWERSRVLAFDRLDNESAGDAIRIPLREAGRSITPDALTWTVEQSHGYPYFLQVLGDKLWNKSSSSAVPITRDGAERVLAEFQIERNQFYGRRYRELERQGLVPAAAALAEAYGDMDALSGPDITEALEQVVESASSVRDGQSATDLLDRLNDLGYVWNTESAVEDRWIKGIPSLMQFVALRAAGNR